MLVDSGTFLAGVRQQGAALGVVEREDVDVRLVIAGSLGAQAGEARRREVISAGGFSRFRRAAETPFNLVLEARP